jgi:hypothetical protein
MHTTGYERWHRAHASLRALSTSIDRRALPFREETTTLSYDVFVANGHLYEH